MRKSATHLLGGEVPDAGQEVDEHHTAVADVEEVGMRMRYLGHNSSLLTGREWSGGGASMH